MKHVEQHILELYVLNTAAVEPRKVEIEAHLAECAGCRALVEQMTESYGNVEETFNELEAGAETTGRNLVPRRFQSIAPKTPDTMASASYRPVTALQRFQYFVRRHPVMVGGGTFLALAGFALIANIMLKPNVTKDLNPEFYRYNPASNTAEILNKNHEILWQIPTRNVVGIQRSEHDFGTPAIVIADSSSNSKITTTIWHPGDGPEAGSPYVRVYDFKGSVLKKAEFDESVEYLGRVYSDNWRTDKVVAIDKGEKEFFVCWGNGRSPNVISRYDAHGTELGQYWHFGNITGMFPVDVDNDGRKELVITGSNDVLDSVGGQFPAIAVLDPERMIGKKKSACSSGFALPASDAEIFYVRLPLSPLSAALTKYERVNRLQWAGDNRQAFLVTNTSQEMDPDVANYEYIFQSNFSIAEVKSTDVTDLLYAQKVREGLVKGSLDAAYLQALKTAVRYWDGEKWVKVAVKITNREVVQE